MVVTFIGHRKLPENHDLYLRLKEIIINLIDKQNADTFLFGSRSAFDDLCLNVVTELKSIRPNIKRIYVRSSYSHISKNYENYLLEYYDETYIPEKVVRAGRAAYAERNFHMIDKADLCIFYYNKDYEPPIKPATRKQLFSYQPKSGTKVAYEYATLKKKRVLNLYQ